jgi:hypothetical protein
MKRREDGRGGQSEEQGEKGVQPVGLPNIKRNCHVSAAIHLAAIGVGYNKVTNTQLWEYVDDFTGHKGSMSERHMGEILGAMDLTQVSGAAEGDALEILNHLRGKEKHEGQGWHWKCRCTRVEFEASPQGVVRLEGRVKAGETVSSNMQYCCGCGKMTAEKSLKVGKTQHTVAVAGRGGFWDGELDQGVWVQGEERKHWFQTVGALVWKESAEGRKRKAQKLNDSQKGCGGHFVARRRVHGTWWECDDTSVQPYSKRADEQEEGEIRAVILQRMQIPGQIARSGQEIITLQEARREVERWWKMPQLGSRGQGEGGRLRHWKRLQERGGIAPARIERLLRTWPELDEEQGVRENDEGARVMSTEGLEGDAGAAGEEHARARSAPRGERGGGGRAQDTIVRAQVFTIVL